MMFRERPRALCARALARFRHVPGAAGRDRGARVLTGGAKRTRRREDPTEPECGDVRTDLSQWLAFTNEPEGAWVSERTDLVAAARTNPRCACSKRTRIVRIQRNPSAGIRTSRPRASARTDPKRCAKSERTRAERQSDEARAPTELHERTRPVAIRTNPSRAQAKRTRAARDRPTNSTSNRVARTNPSGSRSKRTRAVH